MGSFVLNGVIINFNFYVNLLFFLYGVFVFEDVGVMVYKGVVCLLVGDKLGGNFENVVGILVVEVYYVGFICM